MAKLFSSDNPMLEDFSSLGFQRCYCYVSVFQGLRIIHPHAVCLQIRKRTFPSLHYFVFKSQHLAVHVSVQATSVFVCFWVTKAKI